MRYLLVHGAWHASWCWERVAMSLRSEGHQVLTPDLPGHGLNASAAHTIKFSDYTTNIIELIKQQIEPVILVGHSMGGLIITQVADIIPDRIHELIYVAAYIPDDQQSLFSIAENSSSRGASPFLIVDQAKLEIRLKLVSELKAIFFNRCSDYDAEFAMSKLQAQPLKPFMEKVNLTGQFKRVPKRVMACRDDQALILADQVNMARQVTDNIVYLDADHSPYFSTTAEFTSALLAR